MPRTTLQLHADWDGFQAASRQGEARPALVLLHGFTGSGRNWEPLREALRTFGPTLAVDLVGHGASPAPEDVSHYSMAACLEQLEALLHRLGIGPARWLGYSMGGRIALQMAARKPEFVRALMLESTTPGLREAEPRAGRARADGMLAQTILADGLEPFVERWLANPLFEGLRALSAGQYEAQRSQRLACNPLGLANSLRGMGTGAMEHLWDALPAITVPTLLLAGERDAKFAGLAREMAALLPRATLRFVPGAGHVTHVERPGEFLDAVREFLAEL